MDAYREDLAYVHDTGYGGFARDAAPGLLAMLRQAGIDGGLVVDLGCGSGIWAAELVAAGYDVLGVDISEAMIGIARRRAPGATFAVAPVLDVELPPCAAVTAMGECFNYAFDPRVEHEGRDALARVFRRVHAALRPGGVLVFDVAEPGLVPVGGGGTRGFNESEDWAVLVETSEAGQVLTRRIVVFRRDGDDRDGTLWRRSEETHRLRLFARDQVAAELEWAGFGVRVLGGYGSMPMLPGRVAFLAVKDGSP